MSDPVRALLDGTDLRYVRIHGVEVVRRLFIAVRDPGWRTLLPEISNVVCDTSADRFSLCYAAQYREGDLSFRHETELVSEPESILYRFNGVAESDFQYNRIGICVLHPREVAGRRYRAVTASGEISGLLPSHIGVQRFEDGKLWPLFASFSRLSINVEARLWVHFEFEGDLFEMEDQRNWTDASFKTYSTPLALGWPHAARRGDRIAQALRISWSGSRALVRATATPQITVGTTTTSALPYIGLGNGSSAEPLSDTEVDRLGGLRPSHLRVDLHLSDDDWRTKLAQAERAGALIGAGLELALFFSAKREAELADLASVLANSSVVIARVLVFDEAAAVATTEWVRDVRERLGPTTGGAAFLVGTDGWFADLNRERPDATGVDGVAYSVCATVHADDDRSVCETPAAQGDTVTSARAIYDDLPICVSPVTFRPRSWPFSDPDDPRGLPFQVDERQRALLGAAWTVASIKYLAEAQAASITYFETVGWRGVMESETIQRPATGFPSQAGEVFPLYLVLADACELRSADARLVTTHSSEPLRVDALTVRTNSGLHVLVANLTASTQECAIDGLQGLSVRVRVLDEDTATEYREDADRFRSEFREFSFENHIELTLKAFAFVRLDASKA